MKNMNLSFKAAMIGTSLLIGVSVSAPLEAINVKNMMLSHSISCSLDTLPKTETSQFWKNTITPYRSTNIPDTIKGKKVCTWQAGQSRCSGGSGCKLTCLSTDMEKLGSFDFKCGRDGFVPTHCTVNLGSEEDELVVICKEVG